MKKIAIVLGTRPEIIKMSPIVVECQKQGVDFFILHTGQHYSHELDKQIFDDLKLPAPKHNLGIGGQPYRKQVGLMTKEISKILDIEKPDVVIVQGDTISVLAGAMAGKKVGIKIAHHESGLRSHDTSMVEETNRVITDHISDFLFVPTLDALKNLQEEGMDPDRIHMVGNTIVDAVLQNLDKALNTGKKFEEHKLSSRGYILASAHRAENVDVPKRLKGIIEGLRLTGQELGVPVIFPVHPRTKFKLKEFNITLPDNIIEIEPVGFLELLKLEKHARLVMTDSGGMQEESFILRVPCVTLRDNTERPETVEHGANIVSGVEPEKILAAAKLMVGKNLNPTHFINPFGDGRTAERIIRILQESL